VSTPTPPVYIRVEADSLRPFERHPEELTVYTGRRAWARNGMTTAVSALVVAAVLVVFVRWADMHRTKDVVNALRPLPVSHAIAQEKLVRMKSFVDP
jgi:hypothetical protein